MTFKAMSIFFLLMSSLFAYSTQNISSSGSSSDVFLLVKEHTQFDYVTIAGLEGEASGKMSVIVLSHVCSPPIGVFINSASKEVANIEKVYTEAMYKIHDEIKGYSYAAVTVFPDCDLKFSENFEIEKWTSVANVVLYENRDGSGNKLVLSKFLLENGYGFLTADSEIEEQFPKIYDQCLQYQQYAKDNSLGLWNRNRGGIFLKVIIFVGFLLIALLVFVIRKVHNRTCYLAKQNHEEGIEDTWYHSR